jgi:hypothetical protein
MHVDRVFVRVAVVFVRVYCEFVCVNLVLVRVDCVSVRVDLVFLRPMVEIRGQHIEVDQVDRVAELDAASKEGLRINVAPLVIAE